MLSPTATEILSCPLPHLGPEQLRQWAGQHEIEPRRHDARTQDQYGWASQAARRVRSWALRQPTTMTAVPTGCRRQRPFRPAQIAWITPAVARIAISTAAIDEQSALDSAGGQIALEGAHIVGQVFALQTRVVEHEPGTRGRRLVVEDRQHGLKAAAEAKPASGPWR